MSTDAVPPAEAGLVRALRVVLEAHPAVQVVYLFGSRARGEARKDSDVDVAVLGKITDALTLLADLEEAAARPVDLVLLRSAPVELAARVVQEGVRLLVRDEVARVRHHAEVLDRYFDTEPMRAILARGQAIRLQEDRFGRR